MVLFLQTLDIISFLYYILTHNNNKAALKMSNFTNKTKSFLIGASFVPVSMVGAGFLCPDGTLSDSEIHSSTFSLSHGMECAYSFNTPDSHKQYYISATNHGMDESGTYPYLASPWATYPAMLCLGALAARRRWYEQIKEKCRS